jgi:hypothetical protein
MGEAAMSLLAEMKMHGLSDCEFNRQFFSTKQKYSSYCYWCAKQGITALSFNAWKSTVKHGRIY